MPEVAFVGWKAGIDGEGRRARPRDCCTPAPGAARLSRGGARHCTGVRGRFRARWRWQTTLQELARDRAGRICSALSARWRATLH